MMEKVDIMVDSASETHSSLFACLDLQDFLPCSMARISHPSGSLNYANAIIESMSLVKVDGRLLLFHPWMNLKRMREGASTIGIKMDAFPDEKIIGNVFALAAINGFHKSLWHGKTVLRAGKKINKFYIRQLLYFESEGLGASPANGPGLLSTISPIGEHLQQDKRKGIKVMLFPFPRKLQFPCVCTSSTYQLQQHSKNKMALFNEEHGESCREVIFQNPSGEVIGANGENIVILKNGKLISPLASDGAIPGITLQMVFHLAKDMGLEFTEGKITLKDICQADAFFLTGEPAGIVPVSEILEVNSNFKLKETHSILSAGNNILRKLKGQYSRMEIGEGMFRQLHYEMQDWLSFKEAERIYSCGLRFKERMARAWRKGLEHLSRHRPNPHIMNPSWGSIQAGSKFSEFFDNYGKGSGYDGNKERC